MSDGDSIAQVAVVILLLGLAVPALATAYDYSGTPMEYEETVIVDYDTDTQVAEPSTLEGYGDNPTITVGGTELVRGTDYYWNESSGTINWQDKSKTADGDEARVSYAAYQRTPQTEASWTILSPLMGLFGLFGLVAAVRAVWEYTAEVWDLA